MLCLWLKKKKNSLIKDKDVFYNLFLVSVPLTVTIFSQFLSNSLWHLPHSLTIYYGSITFPGNALDAGYIVVNRVELCFSLTEIPFNLGR